MKTLGINILFLIYIILLLVSLSSYIVWLSSNNLVDEIFEIIMFIIISLISLLGLYIYYAYDSIALPGIAVFVAYSSLYAYTFMVAKQDNGRTSRTIALSIGIITVVPVIVSVVLNYLNTPIGMVNS